MVDTISVHAQRKGEGNSVTDMTSSISTPHVGWLIFAVLIFE